MIAPFYRKVRRALRRHGLIGSVGVAWRRLRPPPGQRAADELDREFDLRYGVDTAGTVALEDLRVHTADLELYNRYQGIAPELFRRMMECLDADLERFTFIDIGSGKGRAVLLASMFPFMRVMGVEFAPELHEAALKNVRLFPQSEQKCRAVDLVCGDALAFELPAGPLVVYFYNPFERPIMERMMQRVRQSLAQQPRPMLLILANIRYALDLPEFDVIAGSRPDEFPFSILRNR